MSHDPILSFQRHLQAQGKRPSTIDRYTSIVSRFLTTAGVPASSVTATHAYAFLVDRGNELGLSASWFNVTFHAVLSWLESRGLPTDLRGLRPKRVALQPPRWLTAAETRRLVAAVEQRPYRVFIQVMLGTGLRISEVLALRVEDIDRERPLIRVRCGKGGDGRLVRCEPTLRALLRSYWSTCKPRGVFFQRRPGLGDEPMLASTVNAALHRAAARAGFTERISSHRLRHTFAIHSLRGGMDIVHLSRLMGHRCLSSTLRYVTPDLERPAVAVDVLAALGVQP
jgi:integrase/recombinase XerD